MRRPAHTRDRGLADVALDDGSVEGRVSSRSGALNSAHHRGDQAVVPGLGVLRSPPAVTYSRRHLPGRGHGWGLDYHGRGASRPGPAARSEPTRFRRKQALGQSEASRFHPLPRYTRPHERAWPLPRKGLASRSRKAMTQSRRLNAERRLPCLAARSSPGPARRACFPEVAPGSNTAGLLKTAARPDYIAAHVLEG